MYKWNAIGVYNQDNSLSTSDVFGNELRLQSDSIFQVINGGFFNPFGLQFIDGDGIEFVIMREIDTEYQLDELHLTPESLAIDIGAHVGVVSMTIAKRFGCKVLAYEPFPNNYRRLVANILANNLGELITPYNLAVTADGRDVTIGGAGSESTGGMVIYEWLYPNPGAAFTPVSSVTLKDIIRDKNIDLLKIDCEGAEHEIFEDLSSLKNIHTIRGEFHNVSKRGVLFSGSDLLKRIKTIVPDTVISC